MPFKIEHLEDALPVTSEMRAERTRLVIRLLTRSLLHNLAAVARGANVDLYNEAIEVRRKEIEGLEREKEKLAVSQPALDKIDAQRLREYIQGFDQVLAHSSNRERRHFIRTFVRRIEFDPANRRVTIFWYADLLQAKNFEAPGYLTVRVFAGVGGGT